MKYFRLILANLLRSKRRTFLTVFSIAIALFLFCTLRTVITSFEASLRASEATRLVVRHGASLVFPLPLAYRERLVQVPGVTGVSYGNWFGGFYQDPKNQFAQFAMDVPTMFDLFPEVVTPTRTSAPLHTTPPPARSSGSDETARPKAYRRPAKPSPTWRRRSR